MPLLKLETTVPLPEEKGKPILAALSTGRTMLAKGYSGFRYHRDNDHPSQRADRRDGHNDSACLGETNSLVRSDA